MLLGGSYLERGRSSSREHLSVKDFNKLMLGRDEKIQKEIIEPKDKIIDKLYSDNKKLHCELEKQLKIIDKAEKLENENKKILNEKVILKDKYDNLEKHLNKKYDDLLKETLNLYKIIDTLEKNSRNL